MTSCTACSGTVGWRAVCFKASVFACISPWSASQFGFRHVERDFQFEVWQALHSQLSVNGAYFLHLVRGTCHRLSFLWEGRCVDNGVSPMLKRPIRRKIVRVISIILSLHCYMIVLSFQGRSCSRFRPVADNSWYLLFCTSF